MGKGWRVESKEGRKEDEKQGEIIRDKAKRIENIARHLLKERESSKEEILEWMREILERKGLEVLIDLLEGMADALRMLILIVSGETIEFLPTLGDVHYLKVMTHEDGMERKLGPKGDIGIYSLPLHEGKSSKKVIGHICVALHVPTGKGILWLLPNVVSAAASIESDLLAWKFLESE
ncbi:MAG: hypothetical protein DRO00_01245 [Thermoproteota archaeon]|nr:MAG: hypothetical protein DRN92_09460 [Candidatus Korarchaeota archaeon]RLG54423.1 MAG: hypothetical protein DRO00_01245 [Candidatus Korarchaeota archaeon]